MDLTVVLLVLHPLWIWGNRSGETRFALIGAVRISLPALWQLLSPFLLMWCNCRDRNDLSVTPSSKNISFPVSLCLNVHYQQHRPLLSSEVMMPCGLQSRFVAPTLISAYFLQSIFLLMPGSDTARCGGRESVPLLPITQNILQVSV